MGYQAAPDGSHGPPCELYQCRYHTEGTALKGKPYSSFGRSYNDACITHEREYKQMNQVTAGLICGLKIEEQEEEDDVIDNDLFNKVDGISASGVIEFKREKYESNQAIKKC